MVEQNDNGELSLIEENEEGEPKHLRYSITSYGADYPVDSLVKRLDKDIIYLPEFQRHYVWTMTQASKFIESLLLGLPVPGIFLSKDVDTNKSQIIDGQQRLKTLQYFYIGNFKGKLFKLVGVSDQYEGKTYNNLNPEDKQALDDAIIHTTIIKQDEPKDDNSAIYYIYERLNTGGTLLRPQEIRACIFHGEFNELLNELSVDTNWTSIFAKPDNRLKSQETILRYFAFLYYIDEYRKPLKEFLNEFMKKNMECKYKDRENLRRIFLKTTKYINDSLGEIAFRPNGQLVASVVDSVMVTASIIINKEIVLTPEEFKSRYDVLIKDPEYLSSTMDATSDEKVVETRFRLAKEVLMTGKVIGEQQTISI